MSATIASHYRQQKSAPASKKAANSKAVEPEPSTNVGVAGAAAVNDLDLSPEERELRLFDLTSKYGPCVGMTRLERWERASRFGLQPPAGVKEAILAAGVDSNLNKPLWDGRV